MTRTELISTMQAYVTKLEAERKELKKQGLKDNNIYHFYNKAGHEISALQNAIREFERE